MKKIILLSLLAALVSFAKANPDHDYVVTVDQLPEASRTFVNTHFSNVAIAYCMRDAHSFEVRLADASEVEFYINGSWKEVDCKYKALPQSILALLPTTIPAYIKANFPTAIITKVSLKHWGYDLELNNGLDVEFNSAGQFIRIDD
ncbi:MAG: PepSY-like domain-containing protein [Alistipes sp.]|nr:PepSY-like domain-containing protein [Candidatus Alistipes equi]